MLFDKLLACGIQLHKDTLALRPYIKHVGLRSTICAVMLQVAELDKNKYKIVCDPFCGKSTIIAESLGSNQHYGCFFLMSDVSDKQLSLSSENMFGLGHNLDLINACLKQTHCLPYLDHSIDIIITDLPFGKQHSIDESFFTHSESYKRENFYLKIINEFKRIIVKNEGVLVILVNRNDVKIFENCIEESNSSEAKFKKFIILKSQRLDLGETVAVLYKLTN